MRDPKLRRKDNDGRKKEIILGLLKSVIDLLEREEGDEAKASPSSDLLMPGEAAKILGVHAVTVVRWVREGRLRAVKIQRTVRIPREEIDKFVGGGNA